MAQKNYGKEVLKSLEKLQKEHPSYGLSKHIFTALEEYGDPGGISDKEFCYALDKYRAELEYHAVPEDELKQIIEEGQNLDKLFTAPFDELEED